MYDVFFVVKKRQKAFSYVFLLLLSTIMLLYSLNGLAAPHSIHMIEKTEYFTLNQVTLKNGDVLRETIINGPPKPPVGYEIQRHTVSLPTPNKVAAINTLNVPAFNWVFGCSAVSGAMIAGFYDRNGYPNIYTGPTDGGVMPLTNSSWSTWSDGNTIYPSCPLIASKRGVDGRTIGGSIDDYWVQYNSSAPDPYISGVLAQHAFGDAIGDYMRTSQSAYNNTDGSTSFWNYNSIADKLTCSYMTSNNLPDGTLGRKAFYEARGYTVTDCYNQKTDNSMAGGFSFDSYKAEIDAGHPVLLNLVGHTIVGVGYDDSTQTVYLHDTWDYNTHQMTWGSSYSGMALDSVSIVHLTGGDIRPLLSVSKSGTGSGTVTSDPTGISCGSSCSSNFATNSTVTLMATPASGSTFVGWSGDCANSSTTCTVSMTAAKSVTANFNQISQQLLTVNKAGTGSGIVTSDPAGISCGSSCSADFATDSTVTLTAAPASGSTFAGWSGACTNATGACTVSMTAAKSVTANFNQSFRKLTVTKRGTGTGIVKSTPIGINCGSSCSAKFATNSIVKLTAVPTLGSDFNGWSGAGACTNGTNTCTVNMDTVKSVIANFGQANCKTSIQIGSSLNSSWSSQGCRSTHRVAYAKYYTFKLSKSRVVTIDLSLRGLDAFLGYDPYLYLLSGNNMSGSVIAESDDYGNSLNSHIVYNLPAGAYTIEATTFNDMMHGNYTLRIQ